MTLILGCGKDFAHWLAMTLILGCGKDFAHWLAMTLILGCGKDFAHWLAMTHRDYNYLAFKKGCPAGQPFLISVYSV